MVERRSTNHRIQRVRPSAHKPGVLLDLEDDQLDDPQIALFQSLIEEENEQRLDVDHIEPKKRELHRRAPRKKANLPILEETGATDGDYEEESVEPNDYELREIAEELDAADDYSLYMENEDGDRLIQYHGKLVKWTEELRASKDDEKRMKEARKIWEKKQHHKPRQRKANNRSPSVSSMDEQQPSTSQSDVGSSNLTETCPHTPRNTNNDVLEMLKRSIARIPIAPSCVSSARRTIFFDPSLGRCLNQTKNEELSAENEEVFKDTTDSTFINPNSLASIRLSRKCANKSHLLDHKIKLSPIRRLSHESTFGPHELDQSGFFQPPMASTPVRSTDAESTPQSSHLKKRQQFSDESKSFTTDQTLDSTPTLPPSDKSATLTESKKRISLETTERLSEQESTSLHTADSIAGSDSDQKRRKTNLSTSDVSSSENNVVVRRSQRTTRSISLSTKHTASTQEDDTTIAAESDGNQSSTDMNVTAPAEVSDTENADNMATLQLTMVNDQTEAAAGVTNSILLPQADHTAFSNLTMMGGNATSLANITNMTNITVMGKNQKQNLTVIRNESVFEDRRPFYLQGFMDDCKQLSQLLHVIDQDKLLQWDQLPSDVLKKPRKLGEGTYGEVYATQINGRDIALKVMPIVADQFTSDKVVNGENINTAIDVIPEVIITKVLASLHDDAVDYSTPNFIPLISCHVVQGCYPKSLLTAWDEFDKKKRKESMARRDEYPEGSLNDRPSTFSSRQQLHLAIGLQMGGVDLESFKAAGESQVLSILLQIALSFVVAEHKLQFEHRDCHLGNVLVETVKKGHVVYRIAGQEVRVKSHGVKCNIIDFTLSRLKKAGTTLFRNCEDDEELFNGKGNYQFDIYRMMRKDFGGDWSGFHPKSNVFWLHYLATELIDNMDCKKKIPARRKKELMKMFNELLQMSRVAEMLVSPVFASLITEYLEKPDE